MNVVGCREFGIGDNRGEEVGEEIREKDDKEANHLDNRIVINHVVKG